jgi:hypothetical protein
MPDAALLMALREICATETSYAGVAARLDAAGIPPRHAARWCHQSVRLVMNRLGLPDLRARIAVRDPALLPALREICTTETTYMDVAARLDAAGIPPARTARWNPSSVRHVMKRLGLAFPDPRVRLATRDAALLPVLREICAIETSYAGVAIRLNAAGIRFEPLIGTGRASEASYLGSAWPSPWPLPRAPPSHRQFARFSRPAPSPIVAASRRR